jgi:hypothetical protein
MLDVCVLQYLRVHRHERCIENTSCGYDHLVGWVAVKFARKLRRFDANTGREFDQTNARIR